MLLATHRGPGGETLRWLREVFVLEVLAFEVRMSGVIAGFTLNPLICFSVTPAYF